MPYVNDRRAVTHYARLTQVDRTGTRRDYGLFDKTYSAADQYGWRSKGEAAASKDALAAIVQNATWSDTTSVVAAYDRMYAAMDAPLIRNASNTQCHERRYTEREVTGVQPVIKYRLPWESNWTTVRPIFQSSTYSEPAIASDSDIRAVGGNLLRASRPTKPVTNMTQWFGELRQFGSGFSVLTKLPKSPPSKVGNLRVKDMFKANATRKGNYVNAPLKTVGTSYVAGQFAWLPFFGELIKAIEVVANSDAVLDQFVVDSGKLVRRSRSRTTYSDAKSYSGNLTGIGSPSAYVSNGASLLGTGVQTGARLSDGNPDFGLSFDTTVIRREGYRSGASWEYFVADPIGAVQSMKKQAQ